MDQTAYGLRVTVPLDYDAAIERATEALKEEGFGVLTAIDVEQTLKQKLDAEFRKHVQVVANRAATGGRNTPSRRWPY